MSSYKWIAGLAVACAFVTSSFAGGVTCHGGKFLGEQQDAEGLSLASDDTVSASFESHQDGEQAQYQFQISSEETTIFTLDGTLNPAPPASKTTGYFFDKEKYRWRKNRIFAFEYVITPGKGDDGADNISEVRIQVPQKLSPDVFKNHVVLTTVNFKNGKPTEQYLSWCRPFKQ